MARYSVNNYTVETLLASIKSGGIAIPEMQRPFVWDGSKVRDLIDSLYKGFPVGYIIVWQNPDVKLKDGTVSVGKQVLIDGQQRITAMAAAIVGNEVLDDHYKWRRIAIAFNPLEEKFEVSNNAIRNSSKWIPDIAPVLEPAFDTFSFVMEYCQKNEIPEQMSQINAIINKLRGIQNNSLGVITLANDLDIDSVTEIFIRINSKGVVLSQADFAMSKISSNETFGGNITRKTIDSFAGKALVGNVCSPDGSHIADGYAIFSKNGIRVAVIGMVTPNIVKWDPFNLDGYIVTDPASEIRKILGQIDGQYDVLVGLMHMGIKNQFNVENSGAADLAQAFPQFDVIIASHDHTLIDDEEINGVMIVENQNMAQSMIRIDLTLEKAKTGTGQDTRPSPLWQVTGRSAEAVMTADYAPDEAFLKEFEPYHKMAVADCQKTIGELKGAPLVPEDDIDGIPTAQIEDTALMDFINEVQLYYSGADVSAAALFVKDSNLYPGSIRKCDVTHIYKYTNTLYKLEMTGSQLKRYMESTARYYNTFRKGDLTISFNPEISIYSYDVFAGVNYVIDISAEPGSRIRDLTWPDGTPVKDDDVFTIALNNFRSSFLLTPGNVFEEDDMPKLLEVDISSNIGGIRDLIRDYILSVKGGVITPHKDNNWHIIGNDWDEQLHQKVVEMLKSGKLTLPVSEDGRAYNVKAVTEADVRAAEQSGE